MIFDYLINQIFEDLFPTKYLIVPISVLYDFANRKSIPLRTKRRASQQRVGKLRYILRNAATV
jgi:hypothetical protein